MTDAASVAVERLIALARVVLAASLLLTALLLPPLDFPAPGLLVFTLGLYLAYSLVLLIFLHHKAEMRWASRALVGDVLVLFVVLLAAPSLPLSSLYFVLFLAAVVGARQGWVRGLLLSVALSVLFLRVSLRAAVGLEAANWSALLSPERLAVLGGLMTGGSLIGYLAARERRYLEQRYETESVAALLRLDAAWEEVWRRWLAELCRRFQAQRALLAHCEADSDRVVVWQFSVEGGGGSYREEERPPRDAAMFLVNEGDTSFLAMLPAGTSVAPVIARQGLSERPAPAPALPVRFLEEFRPQSVLSVAVPVSENPSSRLWLLDARAGAFGLEQLDAAQELLRSLAPTLANLLAVRRVIAQATAAERERISRDLHDGFAQTIASLEMRLSVVARQAEGNASPLSEELEQLRTLVREEKERLRGYLRELKPVRIPPSELANWVLAHCMQWQQETGIAVDAIVEPVGATLPEGVCREVFLIVREALHNVRQHAGASHVLVKLRQDENYLRLLVDDDGRGFPFTGTYSQHALEELGLGPVSICARARSLGATLSIDSTPGSGATLRVDIPLS